MIDFDVITGPNPSEAAEKPAGHQAPPGPEPRPLQPASPVSAPARLAPPAPAGSKA